MQAIDFYHNQTLPRIEIVEERKSGPETQIPDFNNLNNGSERQETVSRISSENKDNINTDNKIDLSWYINSKNNAVISSQVSSSYVDFNTEKFVKGLIENLNYCLDNGIDESIFKIAEIKDQISLYKKYLFGKDENSIFLNSIDLIMDNNSWDKMSNNQIQSFINELTRFEDGVVDWEKLAIFSKQIERLKINILDDAEEEK